MSHSGIRDNHKRGTVAQFLQSKVSSGGALSVVSAYFTIYAYEALAKELDEVQSLRFLFGEPRFVKSLDPEKTDKKAFKIEDEGLALANRLQQKEVARRCAQWITDKIEIRSIRESNLLHGKLYHVDDGRREHALMGSSNFTRRGLGLSDTSNIELNMVVDSDRDRAELKLWFDELWADTALVEDVKAQVLEYLAQLYVDHAPEFIYFKTLFHVFEKFLSGQDENAQFFENTAITDTEIWRALFDFQKDGVKGASQKINTHNGCILADSVGWARPTQRSASSSTLSFVTTGCWCFAPRNCVRIGRSISPRTPANSTRLSKTGSRTPCSRTPGAVPGQDGALCPAVQAV